MTFFCSALAHSLYVARAGAMTMVGLTTGKGTDHFVEGLHVHAVLVIPGRHGVLSTNGESNNAFLYHGGARLKIGFLFNHDQLHQIAHSLPIALELARHTSGVSIVLATTNARLTEEVRRLAGDSIGKSVELRELRLRRPTSRVAAAVGGKIVPAAKLLIYRDNLEFFRSLDVLVVTEKTSLLLKSRYGLQHLKMVHTRHGAGDRAIGFDKASASFDHVLVAGPKIRERLVAEAGVAPERISVVGYPKFDLFANERWQPTFAHPDRPTVIYNPHVSPHLSSWYAIGPRVLDWFASQSDYNLIFAPHVMLFERPFVVTIDKLRLARPGRIAEGIRSAGNIHIDLGGRLSTTMAYLNAADIYLGDVSSQIYEFLLRPRPAVFLNPHHVHWEGNPNFASWSAGPVIEKVDELGPALAKARAEQAGRYEAMQKALFAETFDLTGVPSSIRAAEAIAEVAGLPFNRG